MKKWKIISISLLLSYLLFAQSCLRMRVSDKASLKKFNSFGVNLSFNDFILDDLKIHYAKTGNDTCNTIFFVHGSPGSWDAYEAYLLDTTLIKNYRLISVDRSGFGQSNFNEPQNLETQTKVLNALISKIDNGKKIFLVGHSYGGPLVVNMAAQNKNINGMMIIAGAVSLELEKPEKWRKIFMTPPFQFLVPGALNPSNYELWWLKNDLKILTTRLNKITCKTFILHGTKDKLVDFGNLKFMVENFTSVQDIKAITLNDEDHFIPWTRFELVKQQLMLLAN